MKKVVILQKSIHQYRAKFYELLRQQLKEKEVELLLIYGQPSPQEAKKNDAIHLDWALFIPSRIFNIGNLELYWQPVLKYLKNADLIIVEQANKLLINYYLIFLNLIKKKKVALWGHGKNFQQTSPNKMTKWVKTTLSRHAYWWFAYNDLSVEIVKELGFPPERITSVQNAIDTQHLLQTFQNITSGKINQFRNKLGIQGSNTCLFIGGMYPEKRLSFLLEALQIIREQVSDFTMLFIGSGVDENQVKLAADKYSWIHFLGPLFEEDKVICFALSKLVLNPGLVGLAILDSFTLETPLVTTKIKVHSPEIQYLENNINGIIVEDWNNVQSYAQEVVSLLRDETKRSNLGKGCQLARSKYSIENMVNNFVEGIIQALNN